MRDLIYRTYSRGQFVILRKTCRVSVEKWHSVKPCMQIVGVEGKLEG